MSNLPQPKNRMNYVLSADKLSRIRKKYSTILRQAKTIESYSKRRCNRINQDWKLCEKILHEVDRGQAKFDDPDLNMDFYIWQASKLCTQEDIRLEAHP